MCETTLFFLLFFLWYSTFVPRGIFSRLGSHRGKSWCWPTFWGEFCHVQQPKSRSELLYFHKFSNGNVTQVGPQLVEHDLQDIIDSDPVTLPLTRTGLSRLDFYYFFKVDISPFLQNWYQYISSCSNRLIFPLRIGTVETSQVLATKIGRADWWQTRSEAFLTEFMLTLSFIGSSTGGQCSNCPSVQQRYTGSKHDQYFLWSCK